jgi:hypothetical protein
MTHRHPLVDLSRKLIVENAAASADDLATVLHKLEHGYGTEATWSDVLRHRVCLLVGRANSGKSCELELLRQRLQSNGRACFLIPLRILLDERDFQEMFDRTRTTWKEIEAWRADAGATATFLLDSIDEAELCQPGAFETCVRRLRRWLSDDELDRVSWVISTRPATWSSTMTLDIVRSELCLSTEALTVAEDADVNDGADEAFATVTKELRPTDMVFAGLLPLQEVQTLCLLREAFSVADITDYAGYAQNLGLSFALRSPGDLKWFASLLDLSRRHEQSRCHLGGSPATVRGRRAVQHRAFRAA